MRINRRTLISGAISAAAVSACKVIPEHVGATETQLQVASPNGKLVITLTPPQATEPYPCWSARLDVEPILEPSRLALVLENGELLGPRARFLRHRIHEHAGQWQPVYGIADRYDATYNELEATFEDPQRGMIFAIRIAAHDHAFAVRYVLLESPHKSLRLGGEATHLRFPSGSRAWSSRDEGEYAVSAPGEIAPIPHPDLTASTDKGALADPPLYVVTPHGIALNICESDRLHYPRTMLLGSGRD